jgi:asparagine synthase (glutamine-hydrolysing)
MTRKKNKLILCRDHFGVKPLYYYFKENTLLFSSEIKAFLKVPDWDRALNYKALVNYIHFLWSPGTETPFKYVKKLKAGHFVEINLENPSFSPVQYYEIPFKGEVENYTEEEWAKKVDTTFTKAVERQLLSDVPVGFFLSGGLDSSIIVAKAKELTGKKLQCYTIDTELDRNNKEGFANDLHYAKKVAKYLDVKLEVVPADVDIIHDFDRMIWHLDEPQADAAPLNVLNICKVARQKGNVVLLGGAGGDDLFSGYRRHQALNLEKYLANMPRPVLQFSKSIVSQFPSTNPFFRRAQKLLKDSTKSFEDRLAGYYEWLPLEINKSLFNKSVQSEIVDYAPSSNLIKSLNNIPNEKEALNKLLYWDMKFFLTDHNLNYTDKMSMAVGVEARVPFLDTELVELSTKIPTSLKMKGNTAKYILKKMAEKYLPNEVIYRPKTGFGAPVRKWIIEDLNELIHEYLSPQNIKDRGLFDEKAVWQLIENNKKGKVDASYSIWCLLAIESWFRQFVD